MTHTIARRDGFEISTDQARLDLDLVCGFLQGSYWAEGIPREKLEASFRNARAFGVYAEEGAQVGFARVVTDGVRFAYLSDLFILENLRGKGLGKWLMEAICAHDRLADVERWFLITRDAQDFYRPLGFEDAPEGIVMLRSALKEPSV
jgi:N-acetylglutamate synthase-like GNAT family acetyltransferase